MKSNIDLRSGPVVKIICTIIILLVLVLRLYLFSFTIGYATSLSWDLFVYVLEAIVYVFGLLTTLLYLYYLEKKSNTWFILPLVFFMIHDLINISNDFIRHSVMNFSYFFSVLLPSLLFLGCLVITIINVIMKFKINLLAIITLSVALVISIGITPVISQYFFFRFNFESVLLISILIGYQYVKSPNRNRLSSDVYQQLAKLKKLYDEQYLSAEEYEAKRKELLERI